MIANVIGYIALVFFVIRLTIDAYGVTQGIEITSSDRLEVICWIVIAAYCFK